MPSLPTLVAGKNYAVTVQLLKDGVTYPEADLTGATVTSSVVERGHPATKPIDGDSVSFVAATGIATITWTDVETAAFRTDPDPTKSVMHVCDIKVVESDNTVVHTQAFLVPARRAIT